MSSATEQHLEALEQANVVRSWRSKFKQEIATGLTPMPMILWPHPYAETMPIAKVLLAQPYWGTSRTAKALRACSVAPHTPLRDLTDRQRTALCEQIHEWRNR